MNILAVIALTAVAFGVIVLAMAIGVIFSGRCIRGSCGGEAIYGPDDELLNCDTCPVRKDKDRLARDSSQGTRVPAAKSS
jgi:hypothetical protein